MMKNRILFLIRLLKIHYKYIKGFILAIRSKDLLHLSKHEKYIFVFLSANYNNLGDLAITEAQLSFLRSKCSDEYTVVEVLQQDTYRYIREIKRIINHNCIITLIGGGNSGSLYEFIEEKRRYILKTFKEYKIISFPQSYIYDDTPDSEAYKYEFSRLCKRCVDITLAARESASFSEIKNLSANVILCPDIVFSLFESVIKNDHTRKHKACFILRHDKEKLISKSIEDKLIRITRFIYPDCVYMDTCDITCTNNRKQLLMDYLDRLANTDIAITDRLHGMILCYITETPCIVFSNNNHKIVSTYETWLKDQNYIILIKDTPSDEMLQKYINQLSNIREIQISYNQYVYSPLVNALRGN